MTTAPTNSALVRFTQRFIAIDQERQDRVEDLKDILSEAKAAGHDPAEIRLAAKRHFESQEKRQRREKLEQSVEAILHQMDIFNDTPQGRAAVGGRQ